MPACVGSILEVSVWDDWTSDGLRFSATVLSMVPWVAGVLLFVVARRVDSARELIPVTIAVMIINELMLKPWLQQPRPSGSCLRSKGLPSSHSALSMAWSTAAALRGWPTRSRAAFVMVAVLLLVPWARVELRDHSVNQVCFGCSVGFVIALLENRVINGHWWLSPR